jgi:hypothetical protein
MAAMVAEIDATWEAIARGWDIEPREYFEYHAPTNGFRWPLAQAIHHLWKRELRIYECRSSLVPTAQDHPDQETRVEPSVPCVEATGSTAEHGQGAQSPSVPERTTVRDMLSREESFVRLRAFILRHLQGNGGCRMLSQGDRCGCPLCDLDRIAQKESAQ